ncbi:ABC transporter permease [Pseudomonas sp. R2.Fl]|nr:ABC transporter permease [Pseudomonas sp. R2.Fl]
MASVLLYLSSLNQLAKPPTMRHTALLPIIAIFAVVLVGFGIASDRFLSEANLLNVLRQSSPIIILAIGATFVLVAAGIDLSIGAVVSFSGVFVSLVMQAGLSAPFAFLVTLLVGAAIGAANGFLISYQKLPSFIVTLGALSILTGLAQLLGQGFSIPITDEGWLTGIGSGYMPVVVCLFLSVAGWIVLNRSRYGLRVRGIGSNVESVRRSGVPVKQLTLSIYVLSSVTAALAGIIIAMRLQSGTSTAGTGLELQTIAAVVLGGTSLFGGKGTIVGSILGVFSLALINNGLVLNHVNPFYVNIIQGAILLSALWANTRLFSKLRT